MWIVVLISGMLNASSGLEAGYSEMSDHGAIAQFATKDECERARPVIEAYIGARLAKRFGADNIIYTTACWAPSDPA